MAHRRGDGDGGARDDSRVREAASPLWEVGFLMEPRSSSFSKGRGNSSSTAHPYSHLSAYNLSRGWK